MTRELFLRLVQSAT